MKAVAVGISGLIGFSSGVIIATGILAFLNVLGIIPRIMARMGGYKNYMLVENAMLAGVITGSVLTLFEIHLRLPPWVLVPLGFLMGIFVGCLSIAVAEVLDIIPITCKRLKVKKGFILGVYGFAAGKLIGALYYFIHPLFQQIM